MSLAQILGVREEGDRRTCEGYSRDPEGLRATLTSLYASTGAPGALVYNASLLAPDSLLSSDVAHLHQAYDVDVVGAIVATQVAAPAMRAAGGGTILFTGGGWADHPGPAWGTVSLGEAALPHELAGQD